MIAWLTASPEYKMPFPPLLMPHLTAQLALFVKENDFPALYKAYSWRGDEHSTGFGHILALESRLTTNDQSTGITLEDVYAVAEWGAMRNRDRIAGSSIVLPPYSLHTVNGDASPTLLHSPTLPISQLRRGIIGGIGPTYLSKVLRFASPHEYGAIDTRCVRVFGQGDRANQKRNWIELRARNNGYGWYIPAGQASWPNEYGTWINILRYFVSVLPRNCPHPTGFYECRLRQEGAWECADVEMTLFRYASQQIASSTQYTPITRQTHAHC